MTKINKIVREHEVSLKEWNLNKISIDLYKWFDLFNKEFFDNKLEQCVISFHKRRRNNLGHYHTEQNEFGFQDNINFNVVNIGRPFSSVLATLLHEMVHQYQRRIGKFSDPQHRAKKTNYHDKEFLQMTESFGLLHDRKGHRIKEPFGRFSEFLAKHNMVVEKEVLFTPREPGVSKLIKYSCSCEPAINIRVANKKFSATCNVCKQPFEASTYVNI